MSLPQNFLQLYIPADIQDHGHTKIRSIRFLELFRGRFREAIIYVRGTPGCFSWNFTKVQFEILCRDLNILTSEDKRRELFQKRLGVVAEMKAIELKSTRDETGWPQIGNSTFFSLDALFEHYRLLHRDRDILSSVLILLYPCSEDDRLKALQDWINHYLDVFLDYNETNIDLNGFGGQMEEQAVMFADHMRERIKNGHRMM